MQSIKMDKFFTIFGKISLVLIILGSISYGGYYFGKQTKDDIKPEAISTQNENVANPAGIVEEGSQEVDKDNEFLEKKPQITIVAGVSKSAGLSFDGYSIVTPNDWVSKKESQTAMDEKLILTKDGYTITIFQAATGGALCLYPGDTDFEGPSSKFEVFTTLTTKDGRILRRSGDKNGTAFTICQKAPDNSYQQPTNYGHISVKLPADFTPENLAEIDLIISSLKKI